MEISDEPGGPVGGGEIGAPGEIVRRFDSRRNVKRAKKHGIRYDSDRGSGIPTVTTDVIPQSPDEIKRLTGARSADAYMDIDVSGKPLLRRFTKSGVKEIVIQGDVASDDIQNLGRTEKSVHTDERRASRGPS